MRPRIQPDRNACVAADTGSQAGLSLTGNCTPNLPKPKSSWGGVRDDKLPELNSLLVVQVEPSHVKVIEPQSEKIWRGSIYPSIELALTVSPEMIPVNVRLLQKGPPADSQWKGASAVKSSSRQPRLGVPATLELPQGPTPCITLNIHSQYKRAKILSYSSLCPKAAVSLLQKSRKCALTPSPPVF